MDWSLAHGLKTSLGLNSITRLNPRDAPEFAGKGIKSGSFGENQVTSTVPNVPVAKQPLSPRNAHLPTQLFDNQQNKLELSGSDNLTEIFRWHGL